MKLRVVLSALIGTLVLACSSAAPAPVKSTPSIDSTIETKVTVEKPPQSTATPSSAVPTTAPTALPHSTSIPTLTLQPMVRGQKDSAIKVTVYNAEKVWPGTTLLSDHHDVDNPRVNQVNMLGEVTRQ